MHGAFKRFLMRSGATNLGLVNLDWSDLTTLRQERTGASASTPVAVGDPIGSVRNKGLLGGWAFADLDARRPILRQEGNVYYADFDGSQTAGLGDYLRLPLSGLRLDTVEMFVGMRIPGWVTGQSGVVTFAPTGASNDILTTTSMAFYINGNDNSVVVRGGPTSSMLMSATGISPGFHVYEFRKPDNSSASLQIDNAIAASDASITDAFTVMGGDLIIGARYSNGVNSYGNAHLTGIVIRNQLAVDPAAIRAEFEAKTYGTVPQYPAISDTTQLASARSTLISQVFSTQGSVIPTETATLVLETPNPLNGQITLTNLATCHRMDITSYPARPRLWTPNTPRDDKVLLVCAGHDVNWIGNGLAAIPLQSALTRNMRVVTFVLPNGPDPLTSGDPLEHETARSPLSEWVGPVSIAINTIRASYPTAEIYMAGISGGGFTTTLCGACDTRIKGTYDFVGSAPDYFYLNRDYEQRRPGITADFLTMYLLGACPSPRRHKHIWHTGDPVAFNTTLYATRPPWDTQLAAQAASIGGGNYDFVWDVGNNAHAFRNPFFNEQVLDEITA